MILGHHTAETYRCPVIILFTKTLKFSLLTNFFVVVIPPTHPPPTRRMETQFATHADIFLVGVIDKPVAYHSHAFIAP